MPVLGTETNTPIISRLACTLYNNRFCFTVWKITPCCWMILLSVGGVIVGLRLADKKSRLMLTEGSDHVDPNDPWSPTPTFCCCPMGCWEVMPPKLWNKKYFTLWKKHKDYGNKIEQFERSFKIITNKEQFRYVQKKTVKNQKHLTATKWPVFTVLILKWLKAKTKTSGLFLQ